MFQKQCDACVGLAGRREPVARRHIMAMQQASEHAGKQSKKATLPGYYITRRRTDATVVAKCKPAKQQENPTRDRRHGADGCQTFATRLGG